MTSRVNHLNKKTGVTYVYESISYWDKEKKQARNKQVCIGKIDPLSGEFVPSKRLSPAAQAATNSLSSALGSSLGSTTLTNVTASAEVIGPSIILDAVTEDLGLSKLLKSCFPKDYEQIMTMAQYLACDGGALSHCDSWCKSHAPSLASSLTSQRISEILSSIGVDEKQTFFTKWMKVVAEDDYLCYDITSVSSYSKLNEYIKYGYNRDKEKLPQLNLAAVFGQKKALPVYFHRLPGNITDVRTLHNLLKTFKAMEPKAGKIEKNVEAGETEKTGLMEKISYVMDKGFYSKQNVDELVAGGDKFLIAIPLNNKWLHKAIDDVYDTIHSPEGYHKVDDEVLYLHTRLYPWGDKRHRTYLHLYYNAKARAEAIDQFNEDLLTYKQELESGNTNNKHQSHYDNFFIIKTTPKRGRKVTYNSEAINKHMKRYKGFQALLSNSIKDPIKALQVYRDKDIVEKCFDDLKNQLDMKRLRMHNSKTVDGRLFVQFIALIYMSAIRKELRSTKLIEKYTVRELLKEMETITKISYSGKYRPVITELTKQQQEILAAMKITPPGCQPPPSKT